MSEITINSARYADPSNSLIDLNLTRGVGDDAETFDFTLSDRDPAELSELLRMMLVENQIAVAAYVAPARQVPQTVTLAQARAALIAAGLFGQINTYVMGSNDETLKTAWEYSNNVSRHGQFVTAMAPQFGLTDAQLDALFIAAAAIDF